MGGGYYAYVDDSGNVPGNPYFDYSGRRNNRGAGTANSLGFIDTPIRTDAPGIFWEAQTFIVTGNLATSAQNTTLDIEAGIQWGFQTASLPEPSTWVMLGSGCFAVLVISRKKARTGNSKD